MATLCFLIFLVLYLLSARNFAKARKIVNNSNKDYYTDDDLQCIIYCIQLIIFLLGSVILGVIVSVSINNLETESILKDKIAMYKEENKAIEENMGKIKDNICIDNNITTYSESELKSKDVIGLVSILPELKSDIWVKSQIEVYIQNEEKIRTLEEERVNLKKEKWLLYFGY